MRKEEIFRIRIERNLRDAYKYYCAKRSFVMSERIREFMKKEIKKGEKK